MQKADAVISRVNGLFGLTQPYIRPCFQINEIRAPRVDAAGPGAMGMNALAAVIGLDSVGFVILLLSFTNTQNSKDLTGFA